MTSDISVFLVSFSELPTLQRYLYLTYRELRKMGIETWTLGSSNVGIGIDLEPENLLVETPETPRPTLGSIGDAVQQSRRMAEQIAKCNPDVVHFVNKHTWNFFLIRALRKVAPSIKIVHTFHDPVGHSGDSVQKGVVLYHGVVQQLLDGVVVHSDIAKRQALESLKIGCPVYEVPLGVTSWKGWRPSAPRAGKRVLVFGRINEYKGVRLWPELLGRLHEADPEITVVIAGKPSENIDRGALENIRTMPNTDLRDRFVEEDEIDALFEECALVLAPYTSITQSGVILDAYSRSRCVVAFDIDGIRQYVPDADLLVEPFDCAAFANTVAELVSCSAVLLERSSDAWTFGKEHFTPASMSQGLLGVYREIVDGGHRMPRAVAGESA